MDQLPTLKKGSTGEAVKGLQNALRARSHDYEYDDGVFCSTTEDAVKELQRQAGLPDDGIVGPNTWKALDVYLVQAGDTLSNIAGRALGDASRWREIFEINRSVISDPDKISPGEILALPGAC